MNKSKNHGLATLAVVSGIVLLVAIFALAVTKSGLAEVKKTQNLVKAGKEKAAANAGRDCAAATFEELDLNPADAGFLSNFGDCQESTGATLTIDGVGHNWVITSVSGFAKSKVVISTSMMGPASFKTSGSLVLEGGNKWIPARGNKLPNGKYECTAITAGGDVKIAPGVGDVKFETYLPAGMGECDDNYSSVVESGEVKTQGKEYSEKELENDIRSHEENIDMFRDLFGVPKENWAQVKSGFDIVINTRSDQADSDAVSKCGVKVKGAIDDGKENIWVEGDCLLDGLSNTGTDSQSPVIVIKNGVVGANGAINNFRGIIYQFTVDYHNSSIANSWGAYWDDANEYSWCAAGPFYLLCRELLNEYGHDEEKWGGLPFFFRGAFVSEGSYLVDVPESRARVFGSFVAGYDESLFDDSVFSTDPRIRKGSFHDF